MEGCEQMFSSPPLDRDLFLVRTTFVRGEVAWRRRHCGQPLIELND